MRVFGRYACRPGAAIAVAAATLILASSSPGPPFTGKWSGGRKLLDNGEADHLLLQLTQTGAQLTGKMQSLGTEFPVRGKAEGKSFELRAPWTGATPFATGELVGADIRMVRGGETLVLRPATPGDAIPLPALIPPPPIRTLPWNRLAAKPPLGWSSWNFFGTRIDDATVREIADAMVASGMRDAGYRFVNIDDTWQGVRDPQGVLHPNHKFPDMQALAAYVHARGLKLGLYSSPGPRSCNGYPGSYGHEAQDAGTWAEWGIDYLKYDWCSAGALYTLDQLQPVYQKMAEALRATRRPMVFSLCEYGMADVQKWGPASGGNLWRTTTDIEDDWGSMMRNAHDQERTSAYAGPGHWNDPDILEVGNGHMTDDEYRTHMSLWSLLAAPLLAGNDLRTMSSATRDILLNREVIAIDQDPLGKQATRLQHDGDTETWVKPMADGGVAVGIVNLQQSPTTVRLRRADLPRLRGRSMVRDVWTHRTVRFTESGYSVRVAAHGVLLLRIRPRFH